MSTKDDTNAQGGYPVLKEYSPGKIKRELNPSFTTSQGTANSVRSSEHQALLAARKTGTELDMSANIGFLCSFAFFINLTGLLLGYAMAYSN